MIAKKDRSWYNSHTTRKDSDYELSLFCLYFPHALHRPLEPDAQRPAREHPGAQPHGGRDRPRAGRDPAGRLRRSLRSQRGGRRRSLSRRQRDPDRRPAEARVHDLVKAADKLSAYIKCIEERKAGNNEFLSAEKQTRAALEETPMPEVQYFLEHFVPSFELNLDEMGTIED